MSGYVSEELGRKGLSVVLVRRLEAVVIDKLVHAPGDKVGCNGCTEEKKNIMFITQSN